MVGHVLDVPTNLPLRLLASDRALLPAGPFRYKGVYHFFMQHACGGGPTAARVDAACKRMGWPESRPGGPSTSTGVGWGHLTSTDGAHWTEQPVALAPPFVDIGAKKTQAEQGYAGFDVTGYFTGSAQLVNGEPRILFPGPRPAPGARSSSAPSAGCGSSSATSLPTPSAMVRALSCWLLKAPAA